MFKIKSEAERDFFCNRNTGKWVLTKEIDKKTSESLSEKIGCTEFKGTSLIVLNITRRCNLDCIYCFAGDVKGETGMNQTTGRKSIDRVLELPKKSRKVVFHGNEPMTNFELIRDLVQYSKGQIEFCMQTNGTLFTNDQIKYLVENNVGISISIDGLAKHQDKCRPLIGGASSYDRIISNIRKVRAAQGNISLITVISRYNVNDLEEILESFEEEGVSSVCFNPAYPDGKTDFCPDQQTLIKSMIKLFNREIERNISNKPGISITNFKDLLRTFFSPRTTYNCARCSGTPIHPLIGIDVDGTIYPCDLFWGKSEFRIGNITDMSIKESLNSPKNFRVYRNIDNVKPCNKCEWKMFCGAECPGTSIRCTGSIADKGFYCEYRKAILEYVASKIPFLHEKRMLGKMID